MSVTKTSPETLAAVYEHGVFRLLEPETVELPEGKRVLITVEPVLSPEQMTELAGSVYDGLSVEEIQEIEKIALDRSNFFPEREN